MIRKSESWSRYAVYQAARDLALKDFGLKNAANLRFNLNKKHKINKKATAQEKGEYDLT